MALFQKRPQNYDVVQYYTLGLNQTKLLVGLGNNEKEYEGTRHNIGFDCADEFAKINDFPDWTIKKDFKCMFTQSEVGGTRVIIIKPTTMMNLSGQAVQAAMSFYKIKPEDMAVVHDELDIDFGNIRTRMGGSSAGHNGIKSIIEVIGEDFGRVRIGIGPKTPEQIDSADFVLAKFNKDEQTQLPLLKREVAAILSEYVFSKQPLPVETRSFIV